ncbi:hypothetical protein JYJ95_40185 [Corallococcus exiguus]|uniref:hypothetical protein n=1 Tax=Corallococcus exiguus TaxID=83462 RepID=UPI001A903173|nr:hypothetical protein [Corallococcus exiguus]MBN8472761.1 hypothetical protein [Corallococcus exiguus]
MTAQLRRILTIGLALLAGCTAQDAPPEEAALPPQSILQRLDTPASRVQAVPKWVGVLKARSRTSGQWTTPYTSHQWKGDLTYFAPIEITMLEASNFAFVDIKRGFYNFSRIERDTFQGQTYATYAARCSDSTAARSSTMEFPSDSTYKMQLTPFAGIQCKGTGTQDGTTADIMLSWYTLNPFQFGSHFVFDLPAVDAPLRIHGTKHLITSDSTVLANIPNPIPYGTTPVEWDIEWDLRPESDDLDLVLSAENYNDWLPLAKLEPVIGSSLTAGSLEPGSTLGVKAEAVPKPGSSSMPKLKQITFYLKSSKVPGIAMNTPYENTPPFGDVNWDLQFEQDKNALRGLDFIDIATVQTPEGEYTEAEAVVSSFDFGGYGEIVAWGITEDDKSVLSMLENPGSTPGVPFPPIEGPLLLPKRVSGSFIADKWKADTNSLSKADLDDSDVLGEGRGDPDCPGDGLTLYEEYRGFILNNEHIRTKPADVDYFLNNRIGGAANGGINLFSSLTGIKVHFVSEDDFDTSTRIINSAYDRATHQNDQHLVILREQTGVNGTSKAHGGPSNPRNITHIGIATGTLNDIPAEGRTSIIAHELAHSVNVPHHGEGGIFIATITGTGTLRKETPVDKSLSPGGVEVYLESLTREQASRELDTDPNFLIATRCNQDGTQSVFSGAHDCIMRYRADVMVHLNPVNERHRRYFLTGHNPEPYGNTLCSTKYGTGFNAGPDGRHLGAASGRGECIKKICASDKYTLPVWSEPPCTPIRSVTTYPD